jgi:hypothetical protein
VRLELILRGAHAAVAQLGGAVTRVRDLQALIGRDVARDGGSKPSACLLVAKVCGVLAVYSAEVTGSLIVAGDGFVIACGLILVRGALLGVRGRLV